MTHSNVMISLSADGEKHGFCQHLLTYLCQPPKIETPEKNQEHPSGTQEVRLGFGYMSRLYTEHLGFWWLCLCAESSLSLLSSFSSSSSFYFSSLPSSSLSSSSYSAATNAFCDELSLSVSLFSRKLKHHKSKLIFYQVVSFAIFYFPTDFILFK